MALTGCAAFHSGALSPRQTATDFDARGLDNAGLRKYVETYLRHEVSPWPPAQWDVMTLTLVAFYYSPELDVARAKWGTAKAGEITAGARPNPSIGFSPQYDVTPLADAASPWTLGFDLDIPLETAGKRDYRIRQAEHLSEAARLDIATTAWRVRSRLRGAMVDFCAARESERLLNAEQAAQERIVRLLEKRLASGEGTRPIVTEAQISLSQMAFALRDAQRRQVEARGRIAEALGMPPEALEAMTIAPDFLAKFPKDLPSPEAQRTALFNRADLLATLAEYAASQAALQLEIARQYPDIHLGPGYTYDEGENRWSLGLSVTLPVLNRNQGPIAEAEGRREEAAARFRALQAKVIGATAQALAAFGASLEKLKTGESLVADRKRIHQSVAVSFEAGQSDRLDLLSSELTLYATEIARLQALAEAQQALGMLEDALQRPLDASSGMLSAPVANPQQIEEKRP